MQLIHPISYIGAKELLIACNPFAYLEREKTYQFAFNSKLNYMQAVSENQSASTRTIAEKTGHVPSRLGLGFAARDWAPFSHEKTPSLDDLGWV